MDDRIIQFRVGVLVLTTAIITMVLIVFFGEVPKLPWKQYTIYVDLKQAPGVTKNTPVRKNGILIGRVTDVTLHEQGGVRVTASIDSHRKIRKNERVRVGAGGLFGDAMLEFYLPEDAQDTDGFLESETTIEGYAASSPADLMNVAGDLMTAVLQLTQTVENMEDEVTSALTSVETAGNNVSVAAEQLTGILSDSEGQFERVLQKSETALDGFNNAMDSISGFMGDEEQQKKWQEALDGFPDLLVDAGETLDAFEKMAQRADDNLNNLEGFTKPLGQRGPEIIDGVEQSLRHLDELLVRLNQVTDGFDSTDGSLGQFLNNPDLYQNLNRAAENLELLTDRMRPVVENVNVFSDKIAREPSRIFNIRNAMQKRSSGTKW